jgi:hypothetical protein
MQTFQELVQTLVQSNVPIYLAVIIATAIRAIEITIRKRKKKINDE